MKRLFLLFALECNALMLPSLNNTALWSSDEDLGFRDLIAFRYCEPFESFYNGKLDIVWSDDVFSIAAGFGSAVLDSIYRELEFSGSFGFRPFGFLSVSAGETANISWVPEADSWSEHKISARANFYYGGFAKLGVLQKTHLVSKTPAFFSWLFVCEASFNSLYSAGVELPLKEKNEADFRFYQQIKLGYFDIYNSFAYPGPALGFGFTLSVPHFFAGAGHLRESYPNGHTGFVAGWH